MSTTIICSVIFSGRAIFGSAPLDASIIFTILVTLGRMGEPVRMIPEALSILILVKVSLDHLNTFLLDDELKNDEIIRTPSQNMDELTNQCGNFSWEIIRTPSQNLDEFNKSIWQFQLGFRTPVSYSQRNTCGNQTWIENWSLWASWSWEILSRTLCRRDAKNFRRYELQNKQ